MGPAEIEVRRIATLEDYAQSMRVVLEHASPEVWAETEANLAAAWDEARLDDTMYSFLALRAGAPIATGQLVWLTNGVPYLGGATTAASARGQGAFRALVRARWDEVASRGTPLLLVQAGVMSAPILDRLGFRRTGRIVVLRDHSA